jgi:hypothetical protein
MRVLLDECLPRKLGLLLTGHEVTTVQRAGWSGIVNGRLLSLIAGHYDAFITVDQNLPAQQNTPGLPFGIIVLRSPTNQLVDLKPLVPQILATLGKLRPGQVALASI